jgi:hypothetical protein
MGSTTPVRTTPVDDKPQHARALARRAERVAVLLAALELLEALDEMAK